jgi:ATP-dependent helicase/DNAse subunit B
VNVGGLVDSETPIPPTPLSQGDKTSAIQLTGKIDRIERLPDDSLIITDYKTGGGFDTFDGK